MNTVTTKTDRGDEPVRECERSVGAVAVVTPEQHIALERHLAREQTEALLDEALGETFPASDPVAITSRKRNTT